MLQDLVNYLAPIAVLLMLLGFNDARLAHRRHKADQRSLAEAEERCTRLAADVEELDRAIAQWEVAMAAPTPEVTDSRPVPIPDFASTQHEGMAYFVAGDRVLRSPIRDDGLFLLSEATPADPITCSDIDPGVLLDITMALGR